MRVLTFYMTHFAFTPGDQNHEQALPEPQPLQMNDCLVVFIHVEAQDEQKTLLSRDKKLTNHIKWLVRKTKATKVVLHSFAHLANSKASYLFTNQLFDAVQLRLTHYGLEVVQTPMGYFLNLQMSAPGFSMARNWAEL